MARQIFLDVTTIFGSRMSLAHFNTLGQTIADTVVTLCGMPSHFRKRPHCYAGEKSLVQ
jgi:hypothetical protein